MLHRYWFVFVPSDTPSILNWGCGVTAFDIEDAKRIIMSSQLFPWFGEREIERIIEDVDIRTLDQNHVVPNMGIVVVRGMWFPPIG